MQKWKEEFVNNTQKKCVQINVNGIFDNGKVLYMEPDWSTLDLLNAASTRLDMVPTAKRIFNADGVEIDDCMMIEDDDILFFSMKENFIQPSTNSEDDEHARSFTRRAEHERIPPIIGGYKVTELLGRGGFGEVRVGEHQLTTEKVALKFLLKSEIHSLGAAERTNTEIQCLATLKHNNIIRMQQHLESANHVVLVFELMQGGDLLKYLLKREGGSPGGGAAEGSGLSGSNQNNNMGSSGSSTSYRRHTLSEDEARHTFYQILSGISYAHNQHICHRDLKLENILLKDNTLALVKIADFGLSDFYRPGALVKSNCGTLSFLAPEVFKGTANAGPPLDVWSLGVILFAILCGRLPFEGPDLFGTKRPRDAVIKSRIVKCQYKIDDQLGPEAKDLVRRMLQVDPVERASIPEIFNHVWIRSMNSNYLGYGFAGEVQGTSASISTSGNSTTATNGAVTANGPSTVTATAATTAEILNRTPTHGGSAAQIHPVEDHGHNAGRMDGNVHAAEQMIVRDDSGSGLLPAIGGSAANHNGGAVPINGKGIGSAPRFLSPMLAGARDETTSSSSSNNNNNNNNNNNDTTMNSNNDAGSGLENASSRAASFMKMGSRNRSMSSNASSFARSTSTFSSTKSTSVDFDDTTNTLSGSACTNEPQMQPAPPGCLVQTQMSAPNFPSAKINSQGNEQDASNSHYTNGVLSNYHSSIASNSPTGANSSVGSSNMPNIRSAAWSSDNNNNTAAAAAAAAGEGMGGGDGGEGGGGRRRNNSNPPLVASASTVGANNDSHSRDAGNNYNTASAGIAPSLPSSASNSKDNLVELPGLFQKQNSMNSVDFSIAEIDELNTPRSAQISPKPGVSTAGPGSFADGIGSTTSTGMEDGGGPLLRRNANSYSGGEYSSAGGVGRAVGLPPVDHHHHNQQQQHQYHINHQHAHAHAHHHHRLSAGGSLVVASGHDVGSPSPPSTTSTVTHVSNDSSNRIPHPHHHHHALSDVPIIGSSHSDQGGGGGGGIVTNFQSLGVRAKSALIDYDSDEDDLTPGVDWRSISLEPGPSSSGGSNSNSSSSSSMGNGGGGGGGSNNNNNTPTAPSKYNLTAVASGGGGTTSTSSSSSSSTLMASGRKKGFTAAGGGGSHRRESLQRAAFVGTNTGSGAHNSNGFYSSPLRSDNGLERANSAMTASSGSSSSSNNTPSSLGRRDSSRYSSSKNSNISSSSNMGGRTRPQQTQQEESSSFRLGRTKHA